MLRVAARACIAILSAYATAAGASIGLVQLPAAADVLPVTVFYPAVASASAVQRGPFRLDVAVDAEPTSGNGRLVLISHGSGASPWVYADLARALVEHGFVVAMPQHAGDNAEDASTPGPRSWKRRPIEVTQAIDRLQSDTRFSALLDFNDIGMYGMSAGGHTALTLAGGRWSPGQLRRHCERHIRDDFQACAGLTTQLTGSVLDHLRVTLVKWIGGMQLRDRTWYAHRDLRITAIVAGVPFAADFDPASLQSPAVPLGLIRAAGDRWLAPAYHSDMAIAACKSCELVADIANGGHGALLSPLPPQRSGLLAELIDDPPDFDRSLTVAQVNREIVGFFLERLAR